MIYHFQQFYIFESHLIKGIMKRLLYILPIALLPILSCGGSGEETNTDSDVVVEEDGEVATGSATDLSEYGMDYTIVIPEKAGVQTEITANDWGGIEIKRGEGFMMSIAYGEGDIDLVKFDMEDDLVYKYDILDESENHLVYKREIEGSGMQAEFHFIYVLSFDDDVIEVQNSKDATFSEEAIKKMFSSAKSLTMKTGA